MSSPLQPRLSPCWPTNYTHTTYSWDTFFGTSVAQIVIFQAAEKFNVRCVFHEAQALRNVRQIRGLACRHPKLLPSHVASGLHATVSDHCGDKGTIRTTSGATTHIQRLYC